jgi:hypothetical protein
MTKVILAIVLLMPALLCLSGKSRAAATVNLQEMLASPVDLTVYSPDRKTVIGHAHFTVKQSGETVEILGDTRYLDGQRDWEQVLLQYHRPNPLPLLKSFQANYLNSNGSPQLIEKANVESGAASCRWSNQYDDSYYEDTLDFPSDTYVGAASVVPLQYGLKVGDQTVTFHVFDCAPKPNVYTIDAKLEDGVARWSMYPGELAQMGLTPDLGWLNYVAKPFIPDISVWFNPRKGFQYIGTAKDRFYRGESLVLVRKHEHQLAGTAEQGSSSTVVDSVK